MFVHSILAMRNTHVPGTSIYRFHWEKSSPFDPPSSSPPRGATWHSHTCNMEHCFGFNSQLSCSQTAPQIFLYSRPFQLPGVKFKGNNCVVQALTAYWFWGPEGSVITWTPLNCNVWPGQSLHICYKMSQLIIRNKNSLSSPWVLQEVQLLSIKVRIHCCCLELEADMQQHLA